MPMPNDAGGFFDRFGAKERTGLGGRSKVLSPEPLARPQLPPTHLHGGNEVPYARGGGGMHPLDADTKLLMGIGGSPAGTFRTSEVLGGGRAPPAGAARWLDFNASGGGSTDVDDKTFFDDVERLRVAHAGPNHNLTNIYGTPLHVTQMREEELRRRRPSFGDDAPLSPPSTLYQSPLAQVSARVPAPYQSVGYGAPALSSAVALAASPLLHNASPTARGRFARKPPRNLEPIRSPTHTRVAPPDEHLAPPPACQSHPATTSRSPVRAKLPPPHRKDVANLPGAVYSRAIPSVVHGILYGQ